MNFKSPRLLALGIPVAFLGQCAPQSCAPAPAPAPVETTQPPANGCHPDYVECLPIVVDLDCEDVDGPIHLRNPANDAYKLDGYGNVVGDGVGCES